MVNSSAKTPVRVWLKRIVSMLLLIVFMDALLFGSAGRLDWFGARLLTGLYLAFLLVVLGWATRNAPGLMEERGRVAEKIKPWDKVILRIYSVLLPNAAEKPLASAMGMKSSWFSPVPAGENTEKRGGHYSLNFWGIKKLA